MFRKSLGSETLDLKVVLIGKCPRKEMSQKGKCLGRKLSGRETSGRELSGRETSGRELYGREMSGRETSW